LNVTEIRDDQEGFKHCPKPRDRGDDEIEVSLYLSLQACKQYFSLFWAGFQVFLANDCPGFLKVFVCL